MERDKRKERLADLHNEIVDEIKSNSKNNPQLIKIEKIFSMMLKKEFNTPIDIQLASQLMRIYLKLPSPRLLISYAPMYSQIAKYDLSLSIVCAVAGINTTIRKQIKEGKPVHMDNLLRIADVLGCKVTDLFEEIDEVEHERRTEKKRSIQQNGNFFDLTHLSFYDDSDPTNQIKIDGPTDSPHLVNESSRIDVRTASIEMINEFYERFLALQDETNSED